MKKSMVAAAVAMMLASGAIAGGLEGVPCCNDKGLAFQEMNANPLILQKSCTKGVTVTAGIGASTMEGEKTAGVVEVIVPMGVSVIAEKDSGNFEKYGAVWENNVGIGSAYIAGGYLKANDKWREEEGVFGEIGFGEALPLYRLGTANMKASIGYRFGEGKGATASLGVTNILPSTGLLFKYDNLNGFDRGAAYLTYTF